METDYSGFIKPEPTDAYDELFQQHKRINLNSNSKISETVLILSSDEAPSIEKDDSEKDDLMSTLCGSSGRDSRPSRTCAQILNYNSN